MNIKDNTLNIHSINNMRAYALDNNGNDVYLIDIDGKKYKCEPYDQRVME